MKFSNLKPSEIKTLGSLLGFILSGSFCFGQVSTAPYFMDQRLINPAVSSSRTVFGHAVQVRRQFDEDHVLDLVDSTIDVKTTIDTLEFNNSLKSGLFSWEMNLSPQAGIKKTDTVSLAQSGLGTQSYISKLNLLPVQISMGYKNSGDFKFGLKLLYTGFALKDVSDYSFGGLGTTTSVHEDRQYSGNFLAFGPGVVYNIKGTGFSFGYVADYYQFEQNFKNAGSSTRTTSSRVTTRNDDSQIRDKFIVRKDIIGAGFYNSFSPGQNLRIDLSFEKMPPLSRSTYFLDGELKRLVAEMNFSFFRLGVEATKRKGFYVDPYNLVPFLYSLQKTDQEEVSETNFFGGLKTSKGHGFGVFFSQASSQVQENSQSLGVTQNIDRRVTKYSLSYSYVY